jgi:hypothetical protein
VPVVKLNEFHILFSDYSVIFVHVALSACMRSYNNLPLSCLSYNIFCVRFECFTAVVMKILPSESDNNA